MLQGGLVHPSTISTRHPIAQEVLLYLEVAWAVHTGVHLGSVVGSKHRYTAAHLADA